MVWSCPKMDQFARVLSPAKPHRSSAVGDTSTGDLGGAAPDHSYACRNLRRQQGHSPSNPCTNAVNAVGWGIDMIAL